MALVLISMLSIASVAKFAGLVRLTSDRLHDQDNILFRFNLYEAGLKMFTERPLFGWGINSTPSLLTNYLDSYKDKVLVHNSYLEILIEHGIVGLSLYLGIFYYCFKIGRRIYMSPRQSGLIDRNFVYLWRVFLCVYLINGIFVVMNYQFVNAIIFTIAGIISAAEGQHVDGCNTAGEGNADAIAGGRT